MEYWESEAKAIERYESGHFAESIQCYEEALRTLPNDHQRSYAIISLYVGKVRSQLALGDPQGAHVTLESLVEEDVRGTYMAYPEYHEALMDVQAALGLDSSNAENQLREIELDWRESLRIALDLLARGEYEESIVYFSRSLNSNPGEWNSERAEYEAYRGKAEALTRLGRLREAEECLKKIPKNRS